MGAAGEADATFVSVALPVFDRSLDMSQQDILNVSFFGHDGIADQLDPLLVWPNFRVDIDRKQSFRHFVDSDEPRSRADEDRQDHVV